MKNMNVFVFNVAETHLRHIIVFGFVLHCPTLDSAWLKSFSYWGSGRRYCESQTRTQAGKRYCLLWIDLCFTICIALNVFIFVIYACPQLINDVDSTLSENNGFGKADVKEECSSDLSNYSNREGNPALHLPLVCHCFN